MVWHKRFFALLLILLPTQLGLHFWPAWAMVLGRRVDYLSPTVYFSDVLIIFTLLTWVSDRYLHKFSIYNLKFLINFQSLKHKLFVYVFVALFVIGNILFSYNKPVSMYKWLKVVEFGLLGLYIIKTKPSLFLVSGALSIGVFYSSLIAIGQFYFQHSLGGMFWWLGERTFTIDTPGIARINFCKLSTVNCELLLRAYGTFPHPNVLGGFLAVTLPFVVVRYLGNLRNLKKKTNLFSGTVILVGIIALLLTFSRSAIVVGVVVITLAIARSTNYELRIRKSIRFVAISLSGIVIVLLTSYFMIHNSTEESLVVRQQLNTAAIKLWQQSPLFGVGLGNFLIRLPEVLPSRSIYFLQPVHNVYLLMLSEVGVVGVFLLGWFIIPVIRKCELGIRNYRKRIAANQFIIHTSLFTILLLGLVDHYPLTLQQGQLLFVLFVSMSLVQYEHADPLSSS